MKPLIASTLKIIHCHRRALLTYYLFFSGLALAVITPTLTWALAVMRPVTGDGAISTGGIVEFLVSPGGMLWVVVSLNLSALIFLLQQAGIILIAAAPRHQQYRTALSALWRVARTFGKLLKLSMLQVFGQLLVALPFLAFVGFAWTWLIDLYDPYLLRLEKPPELWWFIACTTLACLGTLYCNGRLYLRWILAVPCLMLNNLSATGALRESRRLTQGQMRVTSGVLLFGLAALLLMPVLVTFTFGRLATGLFVFLPPDTDILVAVLLVFIATYILITMMITFLGTVVYGTFVFNLYHRARDSLPAEHLPLAGQPTPQSAFDTAPKNAGLKAWTVEFIVIMLALGQAWFVIATLEQQDDVAVTAHRGSAFKAPENTIQAIEQAIEDGADYVEIDVQLTSDDVPVLWHDADMNRIFGLKQRISEVSYQDIRNLDAGSWFSTDFAGEQVATLSQALEIARGRTKLFIELKPDRNTPHLTSTVVKLLQHKDAVDGTIIAAADWVTLQEVKRSEPGLRTALIAQFVIGPLWEDNYDILALRTNRVTPARIARAHRAGNELHVWTVNQPAEMRRFIDMGVDSIITDRPGLLTEILQQRESLSSTQLLATKLQSWLH
ncbi:glycerophosphodiester phosphodiesterase family protein [Marinobacter sp. 1_MG-2023]|uniref:glycerophosphodiester phosphodiesterase family protein n=1 Tax=Marinobacter sp. 1_MG-2023 TaxID=3062627 RepID=UPI0026E3604A|nr:glycerophosphodiester phosphodiesterase family protein [Marinobacter sp. 1_MG-2023]MDO6823490.1 glycerophosphodiester phosphodiesterase family protein [Marinobacter sp. 1_MG-2023]